MRAAGLLLALVASLPAAPEAGEWLRLTTPHFELYTTAGERRGRETILHFERVRGFFMNASPVHSGPEFPVRIIAFRTDKQYTPYAISTAAAAYYAQSQYRDYIVMKDLGEENFPTATHEYMHLIVRHSGAKMPLWLSEGWADVYSTLRSLRGKAIVGDSIPGRLQRLQTDRWLPVATLTSIANDSPWYNEKDRAGIFYAEAWALTHMLYLSPDYQPNFDKMLRAFGEEKTAAEAFQIAFGKGIDEVFSDLEVYIRRGALNSGVIDVKLEKSAENPQVQPASPFESSLALAELLGATRRYDEAKTAFLSVEKQFPGRPDTSRSLGYLEWKSGDERAARNWFEKAFAAGESDPEMCFHLAMLQRRQMAPGEEVRPSLLRALNAKPDYVEARLQLAYLELGDQKYAEALAMFNGIPAPRPEDAAALFGGKALVYLSQGNLEQARKDAEEARRLATTAADTERAEHILRELDARAEGERLARERASVLRASTPITPPATVVNQAPRDEAPVKQFPPPPPETKRVEGTAVAFDCAAGGARFRMNSAGKVLVFGFDDPDKVMLRHNGKIVHEFSCGPQKAYRVALEYNEAAPESGVLGWIRLLEF
jgi:tetratricopeptide (TPR) repeat protein